MAVVYVFKWIAGDRTFVSSTVGISISVARKNGKVPYKEIRKLERVIPATTVEIRKSLIDNENFFYNNVFKKMGFKRLPGGTQDVFIKVEKDLEFGVSLKDYWASWRMEDTSKNYNQLAKELEKLFIKVGPYMIEDGLLKFSKTEWK